MSPIKSEENEEKGSRLVVVHSQYYSKASVVPFFSNRFAQLEAECGCTP